MHYLLGFFLYRCYLNAVENYIGEGSQLKTLLVALRNKFSELIKSSTAAISAMSYEGSLSGAISEVF